MKRETKVSGNQLGRAPMTSCLHRFGFVCLFTLGLVACGRIRPSGGGPALDATFGGGNQLSAIEKSCLGSHGDLQKVLARNLDNAVKFQNEVFERGDVHLAQQALDCFGDRWAAIVRTGVGVEEGSCRADALKARMQLDLDKGDAEIRTVLLGDSVGLEEIAKQCR
jgi:hypothetical protein